MNCKWSLHACCPLSQQQHQSHQHSHQQQNQQIRCLQDWIWVAGIRCFRASTLAAGYEHVLRVHAYVVSLPQHGVCVRIHRRMWNKQQQHMHQKPHPFLSQHQSSTVPLYLPTTSRPHLPPLEGPSVVHSISHCLLTTTSSSTMHPCRSWTSLPARPCPQHHPPLHHTHH